MTRLDHLAIFVSDAGRSRDWYIKHLGLKLEFEVANPKAVALQDDAGFTLFLGERQNEHISLSCVLYFQVDDVDVKYQELANRSVKFENAPQKLFWGYGAELRDPDGYLIGLWDERSMREKGG
jgi:catechol 2,3-dioxygenase-like lactoylglutathione lyase family enzyme